MPGRGGCGPGAGGLYTPGSDPSYKEEGGEKCGQGLSERRGSQVPGLGPGPPCAGCNAELACEARAAFAIRDSRTSGL